MFIRKIELGAAKTVESFILFRRLITAAIIWTIANSGPAQATQSDLPALCENAAQRAANTSNVPSSVLRAITLTESGRARNGTLRPWPWTVNMEGVGKWFATREEALAYVQKNFDRGARSFDVGCFQINYRWHKQAFTSIEQMFDPDINAEYAAKFLGELYTETGDWSVAAGAYHSRTPEYAARYRERFDVLRAKIEDAPPSAPLPSPPIMVAAALPDRETTRVNTYPLLRAEVSFGRLGSLVPMDGRVSIRRIVALE